MALNPRQQAFVREYLNCRNGAEAYRRAGYVAATDHVAAVGAARLLTNADIQGAIDEGLRDAAERGIVTQDEILRGLKEEATRLGGGGSPSARVAAWKLLGLHLGMFGDYEFIQRLARLEKGIDEIQARRDDAAADVAPCQNK